jgi:alcohol dehydrogenase class IV
MLAALAMDEREGQTMRFEFATATQILFGAGTLNEVGKAVAALGQRALVVTGNTLGRAGDIVALLEAQGVGVTTFQVPGEPTVQLAAEGVAAARAADCDVVVGIGGGSAIDCGKAIAALVSNSGNIIDYLEVIGAGRPLTRPPLPYIAIPTTAGTGAEVTRNAVLASPAHAVKVSLRSPLMLPRLALIDPELTYSLPPDVTASTGMDALTQVLEPFVSPRANPMTDAFAREGLVRAARSLRAAYEQPDNAAAREDMALVSLFGGLALANAGLGAVHGYAAPLGGMFPIPHGVACARLLPFVMEANLQALRQRQPDSPAIARYREVAQILTGSDHASAEDGAAWVMALLHDLQIPPLARYGIGPGDFPELVAKAAQASSMKANPVVLTPEELTSILDRAL